MSPQQVMAFFAIGGALAMAGSGIVWHVRRGTARRGRAVAAASVPICIYVAAALAVALAATKTSAHQDNWDTARLTPSVALAEGHQVYSTSSEGSVQTTMYPPVWVLSYLPVVLADTPSGVLRIGIFLTVCFSFAPVVLLFRNVPSDRSLAVLGATSFFFVSTSVASLSYSLFKPHADAPALGYAMLASWLALRPGSPTRSRLAGIAILAWLSALSKQVMVPILVGLPVWFFLVHGRRVGWRLVGWLMGIGLGLSVPILALFGWEGVLFNTVIVPSRVPWEYADYPRGLGVVLVSAELLVHSLPLVLLLVVAAGASTSLRSHLFSGSRLREFLAANEWTLPALVAFALVPVSIMGRAKIGGYINTFSPTMYFLLAAGLVAAVGIPAGTNSDDDARSVLALCALLLAAGGAARIPFLAADFPLRENRSQQAYEFLTREDSRTFFPAHPLAHLQADGSMYHFAGALYDRDELARLPLPGGQQTDYFPSEPGHVCLERGEEWVRDRYFPEYVRQDDDHPLGTTWECYSR